MSARSRALLADVLERRRELAAEEVARCAIDLEAITTSANEREGELRAAALLRRASLARGVGSWAPREAVALRTAEVVRRMAEERDVAIAQLRRSRAKMKESSRALAEAVALERAARRAGMV